MSGKQSCGASEIFHHAARDRLPGGSIADNPRAISDARVNPAFFASGSAMNSSMGDLFLRISGCFNLFLLLRLLNHLAGADLLKILQVRPESAWAGEDQAQLLRLKVLGEDVIVVCLRRA